MKGQKTVFLIMDTQTKEEAFLEDIDSVLNTGEVPNIFAADEKQEVMEVNAFQRVLLPTQKCYLETFLFFSINMACAENFGNQKLNVYFILILFWVNFK